MRCSYHNSALRSVTGLFLFLLLQGLWQSSALAQDNSRTRRQIVVGDLVGRTDYRDLKILTKQGDLSIAGEGNGKPFSVLSRSPEQVTVQFYRSMGLGDFNPNTVVVRFFESERTLISALILNEVDMAVLESEASAIEVRKSNENVLPLPVQTERNRVKLVLYNHRRPFFSSATVRQAVSYGINHDYIIKKIISGGKATIARGPFDDNSPLYNTGMKSYKYDPRLALQMLGSLGWRDTNRDGIVEKDGRAFVVELLYQKGTRLDEAISRIIKIDLIKLGIDLHPRPMTMQEINDRLAANDFDAVLLDHTFEDGVESLREFFGANGAFNFMGYRSPTFERYLQFYDNARDESRKKTLVKSMQGVLNQDQPVTFLYFKWLTHYLVNIQRFENFRYTEGPERGKIRPFEEWIFRH